MEAAPSEAPAPARPAQEAKGGDAPGPLLNTLSVEATARLLASYFHVEEDVVRRGFRNVDGATLSFYTDDELSQAGVANAPLRRRMLLELKKFGDEGVPPSLQEGYRTDRGDPSVSGDRTVQMTLSRQSPEFPHSEVFMLEAAGRP